MKLLPSSLAARTVLLVIAIVAVAEWVTFSLVSADRPSPLREQLSPHGSAAQKGKEMTGEHLLFG